jgi:hypothetical protein
VLAMGCVEPDADCKSAIPGSNPGGASDGWGDGQMRRHFDVIVEQDSEGYYVAAGQPMSGCHTQGQVA